MTDITKTGQPGANPVRFVEGNYGRWLLSDDLTKPSPRFGYGGRMRALPGPGLGVRMDESKLRRYGTLIKTLGTAAQSLLPSGGTPPQKNPLS